MSYRIQANDGTIVSDVIEDFSFARGFAEAETTKSSVELQVIQNGTEAVAFVTTPVPVGQRFHPWQRIENPKFQAPAFAGYIPAYTRKRIQATAYRNTSEAGWRIHDGRTGNFVDVKNTKEGAHTFTEMRLGRLL